MDNFQFSYAQVIPSDSTKFDFLSIFSFDSHRGFLECRRITLPSLRWYQIEASHRDEPSNIGSFFQDEKAIVICKSLAICVFVYDIVRDARIAFKVTQKYVTMGQRGIATIG